WLRGSGQWDAPALHLLLHLLRIIQADDTIRIVDEEVETFQEILAENPPDARIRYLYLAQRMNQKKRVLQNMIARLQPFRLSERSASGKAGARHFRRALQTQPQFRGQPRVDRRYLRPCVQYKVIGTGTVQHDRHNNDRSLHKTRAYTGHISGAVRFGVKP